MMAARALARLDNTAEHDNEGERVDPGSASVVLLDRANRLRDTASTVHPLVANAYRRRAAELSVAAWVGAVCGGLDDPADVIDAGGYVAPAPLDAA
jgi:hypothetical protein